MLSTLTCMIRRHSAGAISTTLPRPPMPTLLSRQSSRPKRSSAAATIARQCSSSATKAAAVPPSAAIIATVPSAAARSISTTSTLAPARASRIAAARPLPIPSPGAPPPATIATLPARPSVSVRPPSGIAALLPPQAELFLHRPVGIAEQYRFRFGLMADRNPARHDKDIVLLPAEDLAADAAFARPLDDDVDRAVGGAIGAGCETLRQ